jgi:ABC-type Mn2+/Zn2+ transport system permease subunit
MAPGTSHGATGAAAALPRHPYRDSAVLHSVLGGVILGVAWLTGGDLTKALVVAALYAVVATGWSWFRFRRRIARAARLRARRGAGS